MAEPRDLAAEVAATAPRYRLAVRGQRFRGRIGGRRGHGVGSSMEFVDFRDYVPGDDLRQVDWRGYARTNQLRIRLTQEEVAPHVDVLLDTSASMASTAAKERAVRLLALALQRWAQREGAVARVLALGAGAVDPTVEPFAGAATDPALPAVPLRANGIRVLLTDGLWTGDPTALLRRISTGAAFVACVQVLDPWEIEPVAEGALTIVDVETGARHEVQLDAATAAACRERVGRLCDGLRASVLAGGGVHVRTSAADLATMCSRDLLPGSVLEPA